MTADEGRDDLFRMTPEEYGADYAAHYFEEYKLFAGATSQLGATRDSSNKFFLSINTALVALAGFLLGKDATARTAPAVWVVVIAAAGILLSIFWHVTIRSYSALSMERHKALGRIEQRLPLAPYRYEWLRLENAKQQEMSFLKRLVAAKYTPLAAIESVVPVLFAGLYVGLIIYKAVA